jgi:hypothetical protein
MTSKKLHAVILNLIRTSYNRWVNPSEERFSSGLILKGDWKVCQPNNRASTNAAGGPGEDKIVFGSFRPWGSFLLVYPRKPLASMRTLNR